MSTPSKRPGPRVFTHSSKAEWGRAVVSDEAVDRKTYVFEHVGVRTFLNGSPVIVEIDLSTEERTALAASLIREPRAAATKPKRKATTKKPKAAKAAPVPAAVG